ncbi:MAG: dihydropteroate synthase [Flavobacteriaceae bacterium]|nr:dihydropteroate synthase [Flavobacteriaceae bacterium]
MTINCKGNLVDLSTPKVMGIINLTPDSFYDGGKLKSDISILNRAETILNEGGTFLDVGGYSSRPGADDVPIEEELKRVIPAIEKISEKFPEAYVSIDTFRSLIAKAAVEAGACIVNDISGGNLDEHMLKTVAEIKVPYIAMHMKGTPQNMKSKTDYEDIVFEMINYFSGIIEKANSFKLHDIIIDPGFGFAKTLEQNYEVLSKLQLFSVLDRPILVGISRKSMAYKPLEKSAGDALNATTVLNTLALHKGANILRVHDVAEAVECIKITSLLDHE